VETEKKQKLFWSPIFINIYRINVYINRGSFPKYYIYFMYAQSFNIPVAMRKNTDTNYCSPFSHNSSVLYLKRSDFLFILTIKFYTKSLQVNLFWNIRNVYLNFYQKGHSNFNVQDFNNLVIGIDFVFGESNCEAD
jgi:hypothetical protein